MVLCVDEKSSIQALDRTAPILPLLPGTPQRQTHDDTRHGTTNLYAALDVASGTVISQLTPPPPRGGVQEVLGPRGARGAGRVGAARHL